MVTDKKTDNLKNRSLSIKNVRHHTASTKIKNCVSKVIDCDCLRMLQEVWLLHNFHSSNYQLSSRLLWTRGFTLRESKMDSSDKC